MSTYANTDRSSPQRDCNRGIKKGSKKGAYDGGGIDAIGSRRKGSNLRQQES